MCRWNREAGAGAFHPRAIVRILLEFFKKQQFIVNKMKNLLEISRNHENLVNNAKDLLNIFKN